MTMIFVIFSLSAGYAFAQQVKGTVKSSTGEPLIGAAVMVDGTTTGTVTDLDGQFVLAASANATLSVQMIGFVTKSVPVNGQTELVIVLDEDAQLLDDVVVVGYGVQKKSVVTAAIAIVTSEKLKNQSNNRIDAVLQGMTSGVTITTTSGAPDASSQVRIRGVGSINNSEPLYIIDGMPTQSGMDYLNPNDIERIEVLKDAASGAVYGARAANGVILVTTKKGSAGKTKVSYDFSYGFQNPWRVPETLNATEYAIMMNEGYINRGDAPIYENPYEFGEGTNWSKAIFNPNAPIMKHDLSVSGGNDKVTYNVSGGYLSREGIVGGNFGRSNYDRVTFRQNLQAKLFDKSSERNWLNKLVLEENVSYAHINSRGIDNNNEYGSALASAISMSPLMPIYATAEMEEEYKTKYADYYPFIIRNKDGVAYSVVDGAVYNEMKNPLAEMDRPATTYTTDKIVAAGSLELQIWDNLKFKTSINVDLAFWGNHGYSLPYFLSSKNFNIDQVLKETVYDKNGNATIVEKPSYASGASQEMNRAFTWQVENVLSYNKTVNKHTFNALLGQSALKTSSSNVGASALGLKFPYDPWKISVNNTYGQQKDGDRNGWGSWNSIVYSIASYFGRLSYNYDERYMAEVTMRMDGSSRFGDNNKWGYFPSVSFGWNAKNEAFLKDVAWLSALKVRGSYGINGNDSIGNFTYAVYTQANNNYVFGSGANATEKVETGTKPDGLANPNVKWEESRQLDFGVDLAFLGNKITFTTDWFNKETAGMLMSMPVPTYAGDSAPTGNVGSMVNRGIEFELGYRDQVGDFSWYINANATWLQTRLTYLGDDSTYLTGSSRQGVSSMTRGVVGMPFPYFYGWKSDGIFQNQAEIDAYVNKDGALIQPNAVPGDVRWVDVDGNGLIDDADRTYIGKGVPDWTFGLNFGFNWKGLDFNMLLQGQAGCQVWNSVRRTDLYYINLPKFMLNRWTGEGSTNRYPRFTFESANENYRGSDLWLEDAGFLRARNVQLGYTLPAKITKKAAIQRLRFYVQAENLFTLTSYSGNDPEVTGGNGFGTETGIDRGVYPQARIFSVGLNLNF
ncbi:MAG: TonB-dependent receptor [Bacteroidales bacterium]|nr:TonB-dependent receptor [Bacteroidales bacterium]